MHFAVDCEFWTKFGYFNSELVAFHHFSPGNSLKVIPSLPCPVTYISSTLDLAVWWFGFQTCEQTIEQQSINQSINLWGRVISTTLLQRLMIWHKCVCIVQNHQSLLVPLFSIVYTERGWQFGHTFTYKSHKVKENVQFYTRYQKRLLILYFLYFCAKSSIFEVE